MITSGHLQSLATDRELRYKYPDDVGHAPEVNGVYMIFDRNDNCIYVGKSDAETTTIRSRLRAHINGDENTRCINANSPAAFSFLEERHVLRGDIAGLEAILIKDYKQSEQAGCNDVMPRGWG